MTREIRRRVKILAGGRIEVASSDLPVGAEADVTITVTLDDKSAVRRYSFRDLAGKLKWSGDAVAEQRRLRDEW